MSPKFRMDIARDTMLGKVMHDWNYWRARERIRFGHAKSASTGTDNADKGLFAQTKAPFFSTKSGNPRYICGRKLLRVIEGKQIRPLGGAQR